MSAHKDPLSDAAGSASKEEKPQSSHHEAAPDEKKDGNEIFVPTGNADGLHRSLSNRQVQLVAIGGSIGTALFLTIGEALNKSGPASLLLGFVIYNCFLALINNCVAEMTCYMPVSSNFIRMAGHWVDDALGFCVGWNFFFFQAVLVPFEITALTLILSYWSENIPVVAICCGCIVLYTILNVFAVAIYGEAEFWLTSGKVLLLSILLCFTFITMVGGNPSGEAYGFRYWYDPGAFAEYSSAGSVGKFEGFLAALWFAAFTSVGPEFVGMISAEAKHPRTYVRTAYKVVYARVVVFFVGSALAVGILVPYNDPVLNAVYREGTVESGSAAASPWIIAMKNMEVEVLPHIITALLATTIFSAGNTYVFCATRSLFGLALEGRAPKILRKCSKKGVPIYCFGVVMLFPFLSFLQLSSSSAKVLTYLVNIATGATLIDYVVICITYICFYRACKAQNFDRSKLPYTGWFQPYSAWIGLVVEILIILCYGYKSLSPFDATSFITTYAMPIIIPTLFAGWKLIKRTSWLKPEEVDLIWEAPQISAYESATDERPIGFWQDCYQFFTGKSRKTQMPEV